MLKKTLLLAAVVAAVAAVLAPAFAQAELRNWTKGGANLTKVEVVQLSGEVGFTTKEDGGKHCPIKAEVDLEPGSTGKLKSWTVPDTNQCKYHGALDALCGTVDTHHATGLPWTVHATNAAAGRTIRITDFHVDTGGTGIFCPDVTLKGEIIATPNNPASMGAWTMSGSFMNVLGETATLTGSLALNPANTFGIE